MVCKLNKSLYGIVGNQFLGCLLSFNLMVLINVVLFGNNINDIFSITKLLDDTLKTKTLETLAK